MPREAMPRMYRVTMTLAKQVVVEVEATSKDEARELAQQGHGEVVEGKYARLRLLASSAQAR